jgi:hypothetical protein
MSFSVDDKKPSDSAGSLHIGCAAKVNGRRN